MRIDILNHKKAILQQEKRRSTRRWIIFAGLICGIGYLFILVSTYVLGSRGDASDQTAVNKYESSVVRVDAFVAPGPTKHATGRIVTVNHSDYRPSGLIQHEVAPVNPTAAPTTINTNSSNAQALKVHTTSSADVHSVGSGVSGGGSASSSTVHVNSSVPFSASTSNMVMSTATWTSARSLTASNTLAAEAQVLESSSQGRMARPGIRRDSWDDYDQDPEPFGDTVPIGDGLWALLLAAVVYAGAVLIRRRKQQA